MFDSNCGKILSKLTTHEQMKMIHNILEQERLKNNEEKDEKEKEASSPVKTEKETKVVEAYFDEQREMQKPA